MPVKFGFETRKNVYSNQILAGTMTRDEALAKLKTNPYDRDQMEQDKEYIAKKLGITTKEFEEIIAGENKTPFDYKNSFWLIKLGLSVCKMLGIESRNMR